MLKERDRHLEIKLNELQDKGKKVYSISRLNTFNDCQYGYYKTYIEKNKGKDNIYSLTGSLLHDYIEGIYLGEKNKEDLKTGLVETLEKCQMLGIYFPADFIKEAWISDMKHFVENFKTIDKKLITEQFILFEIVDNIWIQGYIDAIFQGNNGKVDIIDWKSSSEFKKDKLLKAGRQLLVYKEAIEKMSNKHVDNVGWFMMKYIYVCSRFKNGNTKKKMRARRRWVKDISNSLRTTLKSKYESYIVDMMINKAIENNNLDNMPQEIRDKYWLEDCVLYYDTSLENINECKEYIINIVKEIEQKDINNIEEWKPVEINDTTDFFCKNLCNHRCNCKYLKKYMNKQENNNVESLF